MPAARGPVKALADWLIEPRSDHATHREVQTWAGAAVGYAAGFSSVRKHNGAPGQER